VIKISKMADYAVVVLASLSRHEEGLSSASALALNTGLPEPTVSKVLKLLSKSGIIASTRGTLGGYRFEREPAQVSIADILLAVDGPVSLTACIEGSAERCDYQCNCLMKGRWNRVNLAIQKAFEDISLEDMIAPKAQEKKTA
jgi:FeS assembly SUF system regulator